MAPAEAKRAWGRRSAELVEGARPDPQPAGRGTRCHTPRNGLLPRNPLTPDYLLSLTQAQSAPGRGVRVRHGGPRRRSRPSAHCP